MFFMSLSVIRELLTILRELSLFQHLLKFKVLEIIFHVLHIFAIIFILKASGFSLFWFLWI